MKVENVDGFEIEIAAGALDLILEIRRGHTMHATSELSRVDNARLNVFAAEVGARIGGQVAIKRKVASLGADHNFVAFQFAGIDHLT